MGSGPLAVDDFFNLKGIVSSNQVNLNWLSAAGIGTESFEVERSVNNTDFVPIGSVPSTPATSYAFVDPAPAAPNNYYRIKRMNQAGSFSSSKIIRLIISPWLVI